MNELYNRWLESEALDEELLLELLGMSDEQKFDAFYQELEFGTGGMRGVIGAGTNRLNILTVRRVAHGIAAYIQSLAPEESEKGFVIAYDNRRKSPEFAAEVAAVLSDCKIEVYLYAEPRTTPQLSFSVRELGCSMGMMITASHNPPEYNGLKIYGPDGAQLNLEDAEKVVASIQQIGAPESLEAPTYANKSVTKIGEELDTRYCSQVETVLFDKEKLQSTSLRTVFTPLHGASGSTVRKIVDNLQIPNFTYVEEQMKPDGEFPTLTSANPEDESAFELAIQYGKHHQSDLLIAVDPDGDRVGLAVWHQGSYRLLNGNETGALALHFILSQHQKAGTLPEHGYIYKTIVTSEMGRAIGESFGMTVEDVLTGFKFIGEKIRENENDPSYEFLFGYEESYGYLAKDFARDKDAIQLVFVLTEMANYYLERGMTLLDGLEELYETYGVFKEKLISVTVKGATGAEKISKALETVRQEEPFELVNSEVLYIEDYLSQVQKSRIGLKQLSLPKANVLKFVLSDGTWVCLRPSGTEPKIKYYIGVHKSTIEEATTRLNEVASWVNSWMEMKLNS